MRSSSATRQWRSVRRHVVGIAPFRGHARGWPYSRGMVELCYLLHFISSYRQCSAIFVLPFLTTSSGVCASQVQAIMVGSCIARDGHLSWRHESIPLRVRHKRRGREDEHGQATAGLHVNMDRQWFWGRCQRGFIFGRRFGL